MYCFSKLRISWGKGGVEGKKVRFNVKEENRRGGEERRGRAAESKAGDRRCEDDGGSF